MKRIRKLMDAGSLIIVVGSIVAVAITGSILQIWVAFLIARGLGFNV